MRKLVVAALVVASVGLAAPALAHVEVSPETAEKGGSATFSFNVEDEQDAANEVTVEIYLPPGLSQTNVRGKTSGGWEATFTNAPSVRFSHAAPGPDGDQTFTLTVDSLPDSDELVFKTVVTYDNGEVDRWIDLPAAEEPPHPAPVVKLTGAATETTSSAATPTTLSRPDKGSNTAAIAGVIIAALVVVGGLVVFATRGRTS
jgi:periplasmic copper chaperone A